jgi:hypothetical protein
MAKMNKQYEPKLKSEDVVKAVLFAVLIYFIYRLGRGSFTAAENPENILNNIPNRDDGAYAIRLNDAFHPYVDLSFSWLPLKSLPDGTDESAVEEIAEEMGRLRNFAIVAAAYKSIYKIDLAKDLANEGVLQLFNAAYQKSINTFPAVQKGNGVTILRRVNNNQSGFTYRSTVAALNIRSASNPAKVSYTAKKNEVLGVATGKAYQITKGLVPGYYAEFISAKTKQKQIAFVKYLNATK